MHDGGELATNKEVKATLGGMMKARLCLVMVSFPILNYSVVYGQTPKKTDDAVKLARGLRSALDKTNSAKAQR
jgi:hypothetical protein